MFKVKLLPPMLSVSKKPIIQAEITAGDYLEWYDAQDKDKEYEIIIKRYRPRRSKDANSYFHVLCGKIADKLGTSKTEVKNRMIALYGQPEIIDGALDYLILRADKEVEKFEELHLQATPQTKVLNGVLYRVYINMRHTGANEKDGGYDSREMSILIDGTISEAKEIGLTDAEIVSRNDAKMLELYGVKL